eukprot:gene4421-8802_t
MPSDLDYLSQYKTVRDWLGFDVKRNPFCVPFPMDDGVNIFSESVIEPKNVESRPISDGFIIGSIPSRKLKSSYSRNETANTPGALQKSPYQTMPGSFTPGQTNNNNSNINNNDTSIMFSPSPFAQTISSGNMTSQTQSFVFNSDMSKLRQAELVILKEESKFGRFRRDPDGRVVPDTQAYMAEIDHELQKDTRKPINEVSATTGKYAPHAAISGVGFEEERPFPEDKPDREDDHPSDRNGKDKDPSLPGRIRGKEKVGGELASILPQGLSTMARKPLPTTPANSLDFVKNRKKQTIGQRLAEITALRDKVRDERLALQEMQYSKVRLEAMQSDLKDNDGFDNTGGSRLRKKSGASPLKTRKNTDRKNSKTAKDITYNNTDKEKDNYDKELQQLLLDAEVPMSDIEISAEQDMLKIQSELNRASRDDNKISELKDSQRADNNAQRAFEIERKRRLLNKNEVKRKTTAAADDIETVYDFYAVRIQTCVRGWMARVWIKWYRANATRASIVLQAHARGFVARRRVKRMKKQRIASTIIQCSFRAHRAQKRISSMLGQKNFDHAATQIQKIWRGIMGGKRSNNKRLLDSAAESSLHAVDAKSLFALDVKELARRLQHAIEEPERTPYPPDEVLHLIRIAVMLLEAGKDILGLTHFTHINARQIEAIIGSDLTWEQAMMNVNRSQRFIRLVRALAYAPCAKPPRLIKVPLEARSLYDVLLNNPKWSIEAFEMIGEGSKCCIQIFRWITGLMEVAALQEQFLGFIGSPFGEWLPALVDQHRISRRLEFDLVIMEKRLSVMEEVLLHNRDDGPLVACLEPKIQECSNEVQRLKEELEVSVKIEISMCQDQSAKENFAIINTRKRVRESEDEVIVLASTYNKEKSAALKGNLRAEHDLPVTRAELIMKRVALKELQVFLKLLEIQCGTNIMIRNDHSRVPVEIRMKAVAVGEANALNDICLLRIQVLLDSKERHKTLTEHETRRFARLKVEEAESAKTYRVLNDITEKALEEFDRKYSHDILKKEKQSDLERFIPTEDELEEDRHEDEREASSERLKRRQFVPDAVLYEQKARPRPLLVAYSRDIPGYLKEKIHKEMTFSMPGEFVSIDVTTSNMGLDLTLMQSILDAKKSIIMSVDHGLTKITRENFIKNFELNVKALIPNPVVIFAMGDEGNMRSFTGETYHGVSVHDLTSMRDRTIKESMEMLAGILNQMLKIDIWHLMENRASLLLAPSVAYIIVLEALFIIQADHDNFRLPDHHMAAVSWKATQYLLKDPAVLVSHLLNVPRGKATSRLCLALNEYLKHRNWPKISDKVRHDDPLLHLMASYVEYWTKCEQETLDKGGVPDKVFFKNSMNFLQTVVTVSDLREANDNLIANKRGGWHIPVAQMIRACLQDMRVMKLVQKIDGLMYTVNIYRDGSNIYFDTYESTNSQVYMTSVKVSAVPDLLTPNTFAIAHGLNVEPPQTTKDMYKRLAKLLRFEKTTKQKGGRNRLICQRDYTMLSRTTRKIDGHTVLLSCFEAALGEIYFMGYIPEFSCRITLLVDDLIRLKLIENYDLDLESTLNNNDKAIELLPFFIDRLRVSPSRALVAAGVKDPQTDSAVVTKYSHQGFSLRMRCHGGAGMKLRRACMLFAGVPHIVSVRTSKYSKALRIQAYEPTTQKSLTLKISSTQRKLLFGSDEDDVSNWSTVLFKKLRLVWRGEHKLELNLSLIQGVRRISGRRLILSVYLIDENSVKVKIFNSRYCTAYCCIMTKDEIIRILRYTPPAMTENDDNNSNNNSNSNTNTNTSVNTKEMKGSVKNILRKMITSTGNDHEHTQNKVLEVAAFDMTLEDIFIVKSNATLLIDQLESILEKTDTATTNTGTGYICLLPLSLKFNIEVNDIESQPLNTQLRYKEKSNVSISNGSLESVISTRKQAPIVDMEAELDELAVRRENESKLKSIEIQEAAAALEKTLHSYNAHKLISMTAAAVTDSIVDEIANRHQNARKGPQDRINSFAREEGIDLSDKSITSVSLRSSNGNNMVEVKVEDLTEEQREIIVRGERVVFERGVKVTFRDGKARWHGHVSTKIFEGYCWGGREGVLRRLRFILFEPSSSAYYTAVIKNTKHLREVLGPSGQDLVDSKRTIEMLLFICAYRLELVKNDISSDGEPVDEGAPYYRLEFIRDRLFMSSKITPVHLGGEDDLIANQLKLIDNEKARGRKILRMARRVSGLLMHLQVFEIPKDTGLRNKAYTNTLTEEKRDTDRETDDGSGTGGKVRVVEPSFDGTVKRVRVRMEKQELPQLKIVGYDPKSRLKTIITVDPRAVGEIAGGLYSPYLEIPRRRELARLVCEALQITFPRGKPFELIVPWSGLEKGLTGAIAGDGTAFRSTAEKTNKRPGRIFRSGVNISHLDLVVTVFIHVEPKLEETTSTTKIRRQVAQKNIPKNQIIMNFYSILASEAFELILDEKDQSTRVGHAISTFPVGSARATAIRNLCRFCRASLEPDPQDKDLKILKVQLIAPKKVFLDDYKHVVAPATGDEARPVGAPTVFLPLDTCGEMLYRRGLSVPMVGRNGAAVTSGKEYLVSVFSKSMNDGPEKGLVVRMYDRVATKTLAIHIGPSEMMRLCERANEADLLHDMTTARWILKEDKPDVLEADFVTVTERGVLVERATKLIDHVVDIVLKDLGVRLDALGHEYPCLRSAVPLPV